MFTLRKRFPFEAAHRLPHHDGKCARLHGHSWILTVEVSGEQLTPAGAKEAMLLDYGVLKTLVQPLVDERLDHHYLNETLGLESPTSERVAQWVYNQIKARFKHSGALLRAVEIDETCTSTCRYTER